MGVNKVILIGNVGKDPEVRYLDSGVNVATFPFATSETYKNRNGEKVSATEWHNIVLWRGLAEIAEKYVRKGSQLYIEGKIRTRSWDDKEGNRRHTTEIVGENVILLTRPVASNNNNTEKTTSTDNFTKEDEILQNFNLESEPDDLPF